MEKMRANVNLVDLASETLAKELKEVQDRFLPKSLLPRVQEWDQEWLRRHRYGAIRTRDGAKRTRAITAILYVLNIVPILILF